MNILGYIPTWEQCCVSILLYRIRNKLIWTPHQKRSDLKLKLTLNENNIWNLQRYDSNNPLGYLWYSVPKAITYRQNRPKMSDFKESHHDDSVQNIIMGNVGQIHLPRLANIIIFTLNAYVINMYLCTYYSLRRDIWTYPKKPYCVRPEINTYTLPTKAASTSIYTLLIRNNDNNCVASR